MIAKRTLAFLLFALLLSACSSTPPKPRNIIAENAAQANAQGLTFYAQREYAAAADAFASALLSCQSIDDQDCITTNRLNLARVELAAGQTDLALQTVAPLAHGPRAIDAAVITAQALIQIERWSEAENVIVLAQAQCTNKCSARPSLAILHARSLLHQGQAMQALSSAQAALAQLTDPTQQTETANAQRLIAEAQLALGNKPAAAAAANQALHLDREAGLPAKIATDLLLLAQANDGSTAKTLYQRALAVAEAARLTTLAEKARQALTTFP